MRRCSRAKRDLASSLQDPARDLDRVASQTQIGKRCRKQMWGRCSHKRRIGGPIRHRIEASFANGFRRGWNPSELSIPPARDTSPTPHGPRQAQLCRLLILNFSLFFDISADALPTRYLLRRERASTERSSVIESRQPQRRRARSGSVCCKRPLLQRGVLRYGAADSSQLQKLEARSSPRYCSTKPSLVLQRTVLRCAGRSAATTQIATLWYQPMARLRGATLFPSAGSATYCTLMPRSTLVPRRCSLHELAAAQPWTKGLPEDLFPSARWSAEGVKLEEEAHPMTVACCTLRAPIELHARAEKFQGPEPNFFSSGEKKKSSLLGSGRAASSISRAPIRPTRARMRGLCTLQRSMAVQGSVRLQTLKVRLTQGGSTVTMAAALAVW